MKLLTISTILTVISITNPITGQGQDITPPTRGPWQGSGMTYTVDKGTSAGTQSSMIHHDNAGLHTAAGLPPENAGLTHPFTSAGIFKAANGAAINGLVIASFSTENNVVKFDSVIKSKIIPEADAWISPIFVLDNGSTAGPGSIINTLSAQTGFNLAGSTFATYYKGVSNTTFPDTIVSTPLLLEHTPENLGSGTESISSMDPFKAASYDDPDAGALHYNTIYFTMDTACLNTVPTRWWDIVAANGTRTATTKSGATILKSTWNSNAWGEPRVFKTYTQLGLYVDDQVDALAVDKREGSTPTFIYSIQVRQVNPLDQILVTLDVQGTMTPTAVMGPDNQLISRKIFGDLSNGEQDPKPQSNLRAMCLRDPNNHLLNWVPGAQKAGNTISENYGLGLNVHWNQMSNLVISTSGFPQAPELGIESFYMFTTPFIDQAMIDMATPFHQRWVLSSQETRELVLPLIPNTMPFDRARFIYTFTPANNIYQVSTSHQFIIRL